MLWISTSIVLVLQAQVPLGGSYEFDDIAPFLVELAVLFVLIRVGMAFLPTIVRWVRPVLLGLSKSGAPVTEPSGKEQPVTAAFAALQLRERAWRLRRVANLVLVVVVVLLLWGFFTFRGAEEAALRWDSALSPPVRMAIARAQDGMAQIFAQMQKDAQNGVGPNPVLQKILAAYQDDLARAEARLDQLSPNKSQTVFLVSTLSTKVGSVLLLVFLVQLLSNLYRYNLRLASFSDSRADFLQLLSPSQSLDGETLARILSAEALVEMDRTPASLLQHATELVQAGITTAKKT
jgi:ABC-type multidrug transport system fused ATPase/permease subunit